MSAIKTEETPSSDALDSRGFLGGLWHGAFLVLGMALTQPTTVISAFVADLTGSTVWVGGLSTLLTVAAALPQLFIARWIEPRPRIDPRPPVCDLCASRQLARSGGAHSQLRTEPTRGVGLVSGGLPRALQRGRRHRWCGLHRHHRQSDLSATARGLLRGQGSGGRTLDHRRSSPGRHSRTFVRSPGPGRSGRATPGRWR